MAVHYPSNVDDHTITAKFDPDGAPYELSCLAPTTMSASIARIRLAEICEEAVNQLPFNGFDSSELDYNTNLALDARFQDYLRNLPSFFQLQAGRIQDTQFSSQGHPYISWQRLTLHFSANTRLCWLLWRFHLESSVNDRYAYSREAGIRSARMVLELRRFMDDVGPLVSINPSRLWSIMQHVFHAANLLATDFSLSLPNRTSMSGGSVPTGVNSTLLQVKTELSSVSSISEELSPSHLDILWSDVASEMNMDLWTSLLDEIDGTLSAEPLGGIWGGFEQNI